MCTDGVVLMNMAICSTVYSGRCPIRADRWKWWRQIVEFFTAVHNSAAHDGQDCLDPFDFLFRNHEVIG